MRVGLIGLGGVGSAAAWFLARRGVDVIGWEQFSLDHAQGSSYGGSRIIRKVYPDPIYLRMMEQAYRLWDEIEAGTGARLRTECGGLFFAPEAHPKLLATKAAMRQAGVPHELWRSSEAVERFPQFGLRSDECAVWEPQSGLLRASAAVIALARSARAAGAVLHEEATVTQVDIHGDGWAVEADGEITLVDALVICGGSWTGKIASRYIQLPLRPTRQQYAHFAVAGSGAEFSPDRFPVWIDLASGFYGFPMTDWEPGVKVALHDDNAPAIDPDESDRTPREGPRRALREYIADRLPGLSLEISLERVCLYTMTPDEDFIIDRLPVRSPAVIIAGLSGHGFKFVSLLGWIASEMALGRSPSLPLERFSAARFS